VPKRSGTFQLRHKGRRPQPGEGSAAPTRRPPSGPKLHSDLSSPRPIGHLKAASKEGVETRGRKVRDSRGTVLQVQRSKRQPTSHTGGGQAQRLRRQSGGEPIRFKRSTREAKTKAPLRVLNPPLIFLAFERDEDTGPSSPHGEPTMSRGSKQKDDSDQNLVLKHLMLGLYWSSSVLKDSHVNNRLHAFGFKLLTFDGILISPIRGL